MYNTPRAREGSNTFTCTKADTEQNGDPCHFKAKRGQQAAENHDTKEKSIWWKRFVFDKTD